jgi:hypothetical protein
MVQSGVVVVRPAESPASLLVIENNPQRPRPRSALFFRRLQTTITGRSCRHFSVRRCSDNRKSTVLNGRAVHCRPP